MAKNVLIIGNGGREHALSWKLAQSSLVKNIFVAPGSYGIGKVAKVTNISIDINNYKEICEFCKNESIHLVAVGPENPLANGIVDVLNTAGFACFGPTKQAAQIESDKSWAKYFMLKHNIPTARWKSFTDVLEATNYIKSADHAALVVKASGLAAGKGVVVAKNIDEACSAVNEMLKEKKFGQAGETIVVEELLEGEEVSVLAFTDGDTIKAMLPAQDHKRIGDGDKGLNTGGMGAYCPCPLLTNEEMTFVQENILDRTISGFKKDKIKFVGVLYAGLMLTKDGPKVLEFNCRFGDPETQVLLPLLDSDLYIIMEACCNSTLNKININWKKDVKAVGVIMASKGYPETSSKGDIITGIEDISNRPNHIIFHSGTNLLPNGKIVTNGGRVLIVVSLAPELIIAAANATQACGSIYFDGAQYRKDIAHKGIARILIQTEKLTYKSSGVNIENGNHLVNNIKPLAKSTSRLGLMSNLGGFGGLFDIKAAGFKDPILVSGTDGVGTKLKIAQLSGIHRTIGIDLVAMCVNDILAHGAEPLFFLDYFACGQLDIKIAEEVILGIAEGCHQAGCALIGGETAEMPDMYSFGDYDLAGFAVGAVERSKVIPRISDIKEGDLVIALPSSGIHSNGFSLVRRVILQSGVKYTDKTPFNNKSFAEELLTPTKIYVKSLLPLIVDGYVKAFAHITGGGLLENIPRVLPHNLKVLLNSEKWSIPPIFGWLAALGEINEIEMLRTFNCGIGGIIIVSQNVAVSVLANITDMKATVVGTVEKRLENEQQVSIKYFKESLVSLIRPYLPALIKMRGIQKKRVGVLISGSGTNLQSLIDSTLNPIKNIGAEIVLVISNKPDVEGLKRAERANILTKIVKHSEYPTRVEFDKVLHNCLIECGVEIVCLAGFMRILSGEFVQKWHGRLLNIHPSLLPSFKGTHAQKQALNAGVKITGCTVHFVEEDIDAGTIILQRSVPVLPGDTEEILTERIKLEEHKAFPEALRLVASGQVYLNTNNLLEFAQ